MYAQYLCSSFRSIQRQNLYAKASDSITHSDRKLTEIRVQTLQKIKFHAARIWQLWCSKSFNFQVYGFNISTCYIGWKKKFIALSRWLSYHMINFQIYGFNLSACWVDDSRTIWLNFQIYGFESKNVHSFESMTLIPYVMTLSYHMT
jgi:hypothetical protein